MAIADCDGDYSGRLDDFFWLMVVTTLKWRINLYYGNRSYNIDSNSQIFEHDTHQRNNSFLQLYCVLLPVLYFTNRYKYINVALLLSIE